MTDVQTVTAPDQRSDRRSVTVIYFLGTQDESVIKIGRTIRKVSARMTEHAGRGPNKAQNRLIYLAAVPGLDSDETAVHNYFKDYRLNGEREWFHTSPELEGFVRWLRMQWFTLRNLCESDDSPHMRAYDGIDGSLWLPTAERMVDESANSMTLDCLTTWGRVLDSDPTVTGDDFYTSPLIINAAVAAMGGIDLDPATHPIANRKYIRAPHIYTLSTNGLEHPWHGRVWCNPPFGQWKEWSHKIISEWTAGHVEAMCVLLATRSLTALGCAELFNHSAALCITRGRIPFWGPKATSGPDDGHAIFYFGDDPQAFYRAFSDIGAVLFSPTEVA